MYARHASVEIVKPGGTGSFEHAGHFGQVGALSTKEILVLHWGTAVFVIEGVDVRHERRVYAVAVGGRHFPPA